MTHAIDRDAIVAALWAGRTSVPKGLQWPHYGDLYIADWSVPAYDPALARNLVREAGYRGEPIPYRLLPNYYTNQVDTAQSLVEMWRQVGLNVEIRMKENTQQCHQKGGRAPGSGSGSGKQRKGEPHPTARRAEAWGPAIVGNGL